ncbi:hypothetical protein MMC25_003012 [Agyrium rufum]|nr:hypothetical protein [Agyrium rufum]
MGTTTDIEKTKIRPKKSESKSRPIADPWDPESNSKLSTLEVQVAMFEKSQAEEAEEERLAADRIPIVVQLREGIRKIREEQSPYEKDERAIKIRALKQELKEKRERGVPFSKKEAKLRGTTRKSS